MAIFSRPVHNKKYYVISTSGRLMVIENGEFSKNYFFVIFKVQNVGN
jgi:hypothetical protein